MILPLLLFIYFFFLMLPLLFLLSLGGWWLIKGRDWCFHTDLLAAGKENTKKKILFCVEASWM